MFSHLACRGINVKGFVTNLDDYIGASICNRPVVSPEEYMADEKGIVITHDAVGPNSFRLVSGYGDAYRYSDVMVINEELKNKDSYLYGTGQRAWQVLKELNDRDMQIKGFIESNAGIRNQLMGVPVSTPDTIHSHAEETNPFFYSVLKSFEKRTGCGVVINTSFNAKRRTDRVLSGRRVPLFHEYRNGHAGAPGFRPV